MFGLIVAGEAAIPASIDCGVITNNTALNFSCSDVTIVKFKNLFFLQR